MESVYRIFEEAQRSAATHKSGVRLLSNALEKHGQKEVLKVVLRNCLDQCLVCAKKEACVDRVIKFFCEFLAFKEHTNRENVFGQAMNHLLLRSTATDKTVRYRACQVIAGAVTAMDGDFEMDEIILDAMISTLTPRLRDKAPNVRMWAIKALARLQNPTDAECPIITEFLRLMSSDSAAAVRVAATDHVLLTKNALPFLIARVRDIKPEVRVAAFEHLAKDVDVRHLSPDQRCTILQHGINDRDVAVKRACDDLLLKWCTLLDCNIPKLLGLVNLSVNEPVAELLARSICEIVGNGAARGLKISSALKTAVAETCPKWGGGITALTPPEIFWAHLRCEYAIKNYSPGVAQEVSESLIPDTVVLCTLLGDAHGKMKAKESAVLQLSTRYLLRLTGFLEQADATGGQELVAVCDRMLIDVQFPDALVEVVLDAWTIGLGRVTDESIIASITSLSEKFNTEMNLDGEDAMDEAALEILAATRGLQLVVWALRRGIVGPDKNQTISATFSEFVLEAMQSPCPDMRCLAVQCLGLMGLSSTEMCDRHVGILYQVASTDLEEEDIRMLALKAITDMSTVHHSKFLDDTMLVNLLLRLMEAADPALRMLAIESSTKLLFAGTLTDARLFAYLLKFFVLPRLTGCEQNEAYVLQSDHLQQFLAVFFQSFFMAGRGRERIAWESITDIVSDIAMLVRSGDAPSSILANIVNHLLEMCNGAGATSVPTSETEETDEGTENIDDADTARVACLARLAASVAREVLKFGSSKADKAASKDFVRVLCSLNPMLWASPAIAATMHRVLQCIYTECSLEQTSKTQLDELMQACAEIVASGPAEDDEVEIEARKEQESMFYSFAPGLIDLVDCMVGETPRKPQKSLKDKAPNARPSARPARSAKTVAKSKTASVLKDADDSMDDDDDNSENVPPVA